MILTAMQLFIESLRIRRSKLGKDHRDVSFTLYNLGLCHQLQGSYKEAIECYRETLRIEKLVLGETHRDVWERHKNWWTLPRRKRTRKTPMTVMIRLPRWRYISMLSG
jgi:tetratricopeptide (TPR) repeat protein